MNPAERAIFDQLEAAFSDVPDTEEEIAEPDPDLVLPHTRPLQHTAEYEDGADWGYMIRGYEEYDDGTLAAYPGQRLRNDLVREALEGMSWTDPYFDGKTPLGFGASINGADFYDFTD